ncbi:MAG: hypothetical protein F6K10_41230 [Moorea sp. SIO2B7]|nr:hypothetical protein [Moorena sp. SIO2B7]
MKNRNLLLGARASRRATTAWSHPLFNTSINEEYRGYIASKKQYFYRVRVHLLSTKDGIPVEWAFVPGGAVDARGLALLPFNLPQGSQIYGDKAFNDYEIEDDLEAAEVHRYAALFEMALLVMRKKNSRRQDPDWVDYLKQYTCHFMETVFSQITMAFSQVYSCCYFGEVSPSGASSGASAIEPLIPLRLGTSAK